MSGNVKRHPIKGFFAGLFFGLGASILLIIYGVIAFGTMTPYLIIIGSIVFWTLFMLLAPPRKKKVPAPAMATAGAPAPAPKGAVAPTPTSATEPEPVSAPEPATPLPPESAEPETAAPETAAESSEETPPSA